MCFSRDGYIIQRVSGTRFHFGFKVENHELILNSIFVLLAVFITCYENWTMNRNAVFKRIVYPISFESSKSLEFRPQLIFHSLSKWSKPLKKNIYTFTVAISEHQFSVTVNIHHWLILQNCVLCVSKHLRPREYKLRYNYCLFVFWSHILIVLIGYFSKEFFLKVYLFLFGKLATTTLRSLAHRLLHIVMVSLLFLQTFVGECLVLPCWTRQLFVLSLSLSLSLPLPPSLSLSLALSPPLSLSLSHLSLSLSLCLSLSLSLCLCLCLSLSLCVSLSLPPLSLSLLKCVWENCVVDRKGMDGRLTIFIRRCAHEHTLWHVMLSLLKGVKIRTVLIQAYRTNDGRS